MENNVFCLRLWEQLDLNTDGFINNSDKIQAQNCNKDISIYLRIEESLGKTLITKHDFYIACNNANNVEDLINNLKKQNVTHNNKNAFGITNQIDGKIGYSEQGDIGDCWLLSTINSMRDTSWGCNAINNAIKNDGNGGAILTLYNDSGKRFKIHITKNEIENAKKNKLCSTGDDDMCAIELACKKMGIDLNKGDATGQGPEKIVKMFCGRAYLHQYYTDGDYTNIDEKVYNTIEKNPSKHVIIIGFSQDFDKFYTKHSYQLKKIVTEDNGIKMAYLVNPWDSSKIEKIPLDKLKKMMQSLNIIDLKDSQKLESNKKIKAKTDNGVSMRSKMSDYISVIKKQGNDCEEYTDLKKILSDTNETNIMYLINSEKTLSTIIKEFDNIEYGWGHGQLKKELMMPIINMLCKRAFIVGVNNQNICNVKNICMKELDANIYTDENKIINALVSLYRQIKQKEC